MLADDDLLPDKLLRDVLDAAEVVDTDADDVCEAECEDEDE